MRPKVAAGGGGGGGGGGDGGGGEGKKAPTEKKKRAMRGTTGNPRDVAFAVLCDRGEAGKTDFVERLLDQRMFAGRNADMSPSDKALARELVFGVVRQRGLLEHLTSMVVKKKPKPDLAVLLHMGLYQLAFLDRVPPHAACHETVQLAKRVGLGPRAGFVNAVLRGFLRGGGEWGEGGGEGAIERVREEDPATGWSHPRWLYDRWASRIGAENATRLMQWNNEPPPNFARANLLKAPDGEALSEAWRGEGVGHKPLAVPWAGGGTVFELRPGIFFPSLQSFQKGWFYVQDPSTLLSVAALAPAPGETILDLCAAPGGKSCLIAERMANRGRLVACDVDEDRLSLVRENAERLGATCLEPRVVPAEGGGGGALDPGGAQGGGGGGWYDRVLVDAPCSNTGVMRRRIDLRWRITEDEVGRLAALQATLLRDAALAVRVGGLVVYSTCSIEDEEGIGQVMSFLESHEGSGFTLLQHRQLTPFADRTDGAFVAALRRDA